MIKLIELEKSVSFSRVMGNYNLKIQWNDYAKFWYCDVTAKDGSIIASGIKLLMGRDLIRGIPQVSGYLWLRNSTISEDTPNFDAIVDYYFYYDDGK